VYNISIIIHFFPAEDDSDNSSFDNRNSLFSNKPRTSETFMKPSCQVEITMVVENQLIRLKMKKYDNINQTEKNLEITQN